MAIDCIAVDELGRAPEFVDGCEQSSMCQRFSLDDHYPAPINFSHQSVVTPHPPNHVLHDLMRRSDEILAPVAPFHTHCELQAEFFYTVADLQLKVSSASASEDRCTDFG